MQYKPLHCWDCGDRVIGGTLGTHVPLSNFRNIRFELADGSYCESPFCSVCATKSWTNERIATFETAVNRVRPPDDQLRIVSVSGYSVLPLQPVKVLD